MTAWDRWVDGTPDGPTMVGPVCPVCKSTVSILDGYDEDTGRAELSCAVCDCPFFDIP